MEIQLTTFAHRHFKKDFGGTKILNYTPQEFSRIVNNGIRAKENGSYALLPSCVFRNCLLKCSSGEDKPNGVVAKTHSLIDGYAPFCKLLPIVNFTDAKVGSLPITLENYQYIRSGYSARRGLELPMFSRWLELPLPAPRAEYLMLVLYDKEQILKEAEGTDEYIFGFESDYGVVAILGQLEAAEESMKPETMLRNALGISEGGSGVPIDRDKYLKSVEFWSQNVTVK